MTCLLLAFLENMEMEFMRKVVSLPWIWTLTDDYTAHVELLDISNKQTFEYSLHEDVRGGQGIGVHEEGVVALS